MEKGVLKITVLKGPKNGEVLVCKPGSKLQIGRVIKGNDFALRDPGISQQHLCFTFDSEGFRWFVSDLDSSNGTILNGSKIQPLVPVSISDHDVISVGERTKLGVSVMPLVLLEENKEENEDVNARRVNTRTEEPDKTGGVQLRRNPRRGKSPKALKEVDMNRAVDVGAEEKGVRMKRMKRGKGKGKEARIIEDELHRRNDKLLVETENSDSDCVIISNEGKGSKATTRVDCSIITEEKNGEEDIGAKEGLEVNGNEVGDHFENMTVDQWFDSMFIFFPKIVHDESEEIINSLKEKAKKFDALTEAGGDV